SDARIRLRNRIKIRAEAAIGILGKASCTSGQLKFQFLPVRAVQNGIRMGRRNHGAEVLCEWLQSTINKRFSNWCGWYRPEDLLTRIGVKAASLSEPLLGPSLMISWST